MELSRVQIALRPRQPWEATDLGIVMLRAWWKTLLPVSLVVIAVPALLVLGIAWLLGFGVLWSGLAASIALWWLKPLCDRYFLIVLSRAVFGSVPRFSEVWAATGSVLRSGLLWNLSLGRIEFARSFRLPARQLEGLARGERRARYRVLDAGTRGYAVWLTIICLHLEMVLYLALYALAYFVTPTPALDVNTSWGAFWFDQPEHGLTSLVVYALVLALLEPIYVACGFALYLNRRTVLEGWDIELAFRRMVERLSASGAPGAPNESGEPALPGGAENRRADGGRAAVGSVTVGSVTLGLTLTLGLGLASSDALAELEPVAPRLAPESELAEVVDQVLQEPPFLVRETGNRWGLREELDALGWKWPWDWGADDAEVNLGLWEDIQRWLANAMRVILWVGAAAALTWMLVRFIATGREHGWFVRDKGRSPSTSRVSVQMLAPGEPLPAHPGAVARDLLAAGDARAALALLYRASVVRMEAMGLGCTDASTEGEVVRAARRSSDGSLSSYVVRLANLWLGVAYADRTPSSADASQLCTDWDALFDASPDISGGRRRV